MNVVGWFAAVAAIGVACVVVRRNAGLRRDLDGARGELDRLEARLAARTEEKSWLSRALDELSLGVVVAGADGEVKFRNAAASTLFDARHGDALVAAAVETLLAGALEGVAAEREVEEFGPPLRAHVVRCFPLRGSGAGSDRVVGAVASVEEITEHRRIDQVRRDFVANISHELRTPIGALGLLAETISDEPDGEVVRRLAGRMLVESERVADTIEDLLELSRIEFGDDTRIEVLDVSALVAEAVSRIGAAAELKGVALNLNGTVASAVAGDRRQLVSALYNLLDNAVKFSPSGAVVDIDVSTTDDGVRIVISDHGPGIPSRDIDRIFERFYRVDRARSRDTGGTGLGLAIVRHVVANHRGEITVDSREGVGSSFTMLLPAAAATGGAPGRDRLGVVG